MEVVQEKKKYNINYQGRCISRINKGAKVNLTTIMEHNITIKNVDISNVALHNETRNNIIFNSKQQNLMSDIDSGTKITMLQAEIGNLKAIIETLKQEHSTKQKKLNTKYEEQKNLLNLFQKENKELQQQLLKFKEAEELEFSENSNVIETVETVETEPNNNQFKKETKLPDRNKLFD